MEQFTDLFNQLQSVINVVGHGIDFPQIVVVGSQSDGKSSVLESIVKNGFLPRGTGVVTRTPIILQLRNIRPGEENGQELATVSYPDPDNSGQQVREEHITDFGHVGPKIMQATERLAGNQKNIVDKPITVTLYSPNVPDLTLVDLPGLVENRQGDQPSNIKEQVEQLIRSYVQNPNAIILAVHPATSDLANSKSLNIAGEVDPNGQRTICVITKLDAADPSENKTDLLTGTDIANHHAKVLRTIGVINKSSADQNKPNWTANDQLNKEDRWFKTHYPRIAGQHGTRQLSEFLAMVFREHIRKCLPALKAAVDEMVSENHGHLISLGEDVHRKFTDPENRDPSLPDPGHKLVVSVITKFVEYFRGALTGDVDQGNTEVRGGARIEELFNETYWNALTAIIPLDDVSEQQVWTQIRNSWGTERQMFLSIKAFRVLVQHEMARMEHESIRCVKLAHQEMLTVRNSAGDHIAQYREQFPKLFERIVNIVAQFMETRLDETKVMVVHCVKMQLDYLNVKHPDFIKAQVDAMKRFNEIAAQIEDSVHNDGSTNVNVGASPARSAPAPPATPKPARMQYPASGSNQPTADPQQQTSANGNGPNVPPPVINRSRGMTKREKLECEITVQLVREYFEVIRRIVRDSVPKVIIRFLINAIRDEVLQELLTKVAANSETFTPLLTESEIIATKRKNYTEKLELYRDAAKIIRTLETV
ncbi:uncharacterized protein LOC129594136 [Paramacrobiotus metropolitanus]|uniref:uncharacterized protein LOC129594136 n=1 Tax=Paramacrobiotus metropolitanus TaxID=2943436 RepID=UPI00244621F8|nr:uncharacterized protein LOC129594136 [Paramacrobiotus metropolitanus]